MIYLQGETCLGGIIYWNKSQSHSWVLIPTHAKYLEHLLEKSFVGPLDPPEQDEEIMP